MGTREVITDLVRHLMTDDRIKKETLARNFGVTPKHMGRKIAEGRWTVDDIDTLARAFHLEPADIVQGYRKVTTRRAIRTSRELPHEWSKLKNG